MCSLRNKFGTFHTACASIRPPHLLDDAKIDLRGTSIYSHVNTQ
jgi:hypothetical protein